VDSLHKVRMRLGVLVKGLFRGELQGVAGVLFRAADFLGRGRAGRVEIGKVRAWALRAVAVSVMIE